MRKVNMFFFLYLSAHLFISCDSRDNDVLKLWYSRPAEIWEEALPIGNGRLGAMVFGGAENDRIQFNEETLWTGEPHDYSHPGAFEYLKEIRELLWQGKQKEAETLALEKFMSLPLRQQKYQPFGDIKLYFPDHKDVINYRRELDISDALCTTTYQAGGITFTREYFASYPANMILINLFADRKNAITCEVELSSVHEGSNVNVSDEGVIELNVKVKEGVLFGKAVLKAVARGGKISVKGNRLHIEKADNLTIRLSAATNFIDPGNVSGNPGTLCTNYLAASEGKEITALKKEHINDFQEYFNRFSIDLGISGNEALPTNERIKAVPQKMDNSLAALYVQYGRYLMLSSSRKGTYPANLQGIWNDKLNPSWDSKYTVNINTEMNYWPVEVLNISECHEALFKMIEEVIPSGKKVARVHYNARGWVLHHNTDLWRGAAPINASNHGIWVSGSGWMAHHYWEHFLYSRDIGFLSGRAWPVMKEAARFYIDFLVKDPESGWLVSSPSNSPENGGLVSGPTMDHEIIKSLFRACIEASEILKADKPFTDSLRKILPEIAPYQIGRFGQLQEWIEDVDDPDNKHRHVSHLWGVHPGKEINREETPALLEAAKKSLIARGDEGTGWSLAWKINFWARFLDGDHAWRMVQMLLRPTGQTGTQMSGGGSYPNLFDAHPPFQIDGNFGGAAGIVEMLLQSHLDAIDVLPALPKGIPSGHIRGLRARGGFELEFSWDGGKLSSLKVRSDAGYSLVLRYNGKIFSTPTKKGELLEFDGELTRVGRIM